MRRPGSSSWIAALALAAGLAVAADFDGAAREARHEQAGNWLSYDRDNTGQRYSPLDQINRSNVKDIAVRWAYQFQPVPLRSEATPLVRDGVMYGTGGGTLAFALDAVTGRPLWRFDYPFAARGARRPPNWNRGFALSGNRLYMGTVDCHLLALDARTGDPVWKSPITVEQPCMGATAAPLVVRNRVLIGVRGGDSGRLRGFLDAFDAETGKRAWRFYTIPEPGEPGSETWPDDTAAWKAGGGAPWSTGTYDPELNLLYWPTGNPGPKDFDGRDREGDNLYSASVLALRPDTGELAWHYQFTPHDEHDWDANETPVLVDAEWDGRPRKLLLQANRNGFFYVLDRASGEFLLAEPFARQTWARGISPDGRPILVPEAMPSVAGALACPDIHGGTNWHAPSYNPRTGLFYVSARDGCGVYYRTGHSIDHDLGDARQFVRAIDIRDGSRRWEIPFLGDEAQEINHAGTMTTAGGLVFFSSRVGNFAAADADTGAVLWHFNTGGTIRASPMTYAYRGRQYVAITTKNAIFVFGLPR